MMSLRVSQLTSINSSVRAHGSLRCRPTTRSALLSRPVSTPQSSAHQECRSIPTTRANCLLQIKANPFRENFKVIVGGSGGWQIVQTNTYEELSIDCVVEGRSESTDTLDLFRKAIQGEELPKRIEVKHPLDREGILFPDTRTTFGVVEMTTGCGRRCKFCVPDLNPQIDLPKDKIMDAVRANVRHGNKQISLATEDMFIWGQVHTDTPFYFPNREALVDLYSDIVNTPGVEQHVLSHSTIAPAVVDPLLIKQLSDMLLPKSPIHFPYLSSHPEKKALAPLIGLETGSVRMAKTDHVEQRRAVFN